MTGTVRGRSRSEDRPVAIVTGASSGIGAATARRLAREGMRVVLAARRADQLQRVAEEIEDAGGEAFAVPTDVRDRDAIFRMVAIVRERQGRIDVLVNNAGLGGSGYVVSLDGDKLREQVGTNLIGVIECTQAVVPVMMAQRSGHIINVSSLAGLVGVPGASVYSATKYGVVGFSEGLRREVREYGIRVTALCPGLVATEFSERLAKLQDGPDIRPNRPPGVKTSDYVAGKIGGLIQRPRRRLILPRGWGALVWFAQAFPSLVDAGFRIYLRRQRA